MNGDMVKSFVSSVVIALLGGVAVKWGLDGDTVAMIGAAAGAVAVVIWKAFKWVK